LNKIKSIVFYLKDDYCMCTNETGCKKK
jgi:hypothetical protein